MLVHQAYRYELDPTASQRVLLAKHAGTARFAFNWGLALCKARLEHGEPVPHSAELHRIWNGFKRESAPWWAEVSKCSPQEALRDLDRSFGNFWRGRKAGRRVGFPRFKKKGEHDGFRLTGSIRVEPRHVVLPRLGAIHSKETTAKFQGLFLSASVVREADRWYVSLTVERERPDQELVIGPVVGVDLGISSFAVLSDGTVLESPKALERSLWRLQRASKAHSRKRKGSRNRRKSAMRLARLHRRVRNQRQDFLHQTTTALAKAKSVIVVEDLNVRGMVRNRHLSRHIADAGWSEFRRLLAYKTVWYGSQLVVAPRFFASSKTCSACGAVKADLTLSERVYRCDACGLEIDRDLNAARNLAKVAGSSPETINACGGRVRPAVA
ncbi:MAG: IS607 family element RNA-guided endonuclease TnpB [Thermaerobacter sp.]|nr:IS607 family element RNA-guided endonuclease TnpB [Thermaerobacter sp.]